MSAPEPRPLASLTKLERAWCKSRVCGLCETRLSKDYCGAIFGEKCPQEVMDKRRGDALATYKPRRARAAGIEVIGIAADAGQDGGRG